MRMYNLCSFGKIKILKTQQNRGTVFADRKVGRTLRFPPVLLGNRAQPVPMSLPWGKLLQANYL